jgi:hypothetical protein
MPHDLRGIKEIAASRNYAAIVDGSDKVWQWSATQA